MQTRNEKLLTCIDPATQRGIEVGALFSPIVTPAMGSIRYVDHATTAEIQAKYANNPTVAIDAIVNVDYVWGDQSMAELLAQELPFDYAIASHVIEHVPDFIGWLREIHTILKPGGILSLAIPDHRYCFDYYRFPTTAADIIGAYLGRARKPSPQQIFEHFAAAVALNGTIAWAATPQESDLVPVHSEIYAWGVAYESAMNDGYVDVHCWVFTPFSFFTLLKTLINLNLFDFKVKQYFETEGCEFLVSLEALDPCLSPAEKQQIQLASLPISAASVSQPVRHLEVYQQVEQLTAQLADIQSQLFAAQQELQTGYAQQMECRNR